MNAANWTELSSAYGATFTPKIAPERNLLPAVLDLHARVSNIDGGEPSPAIVDFVEINAADFEQISDPPTQAQVIAIAGAVSNLSTQYDNTIGVLNVILDALRAKNIIAS
jgi:hypothetical protein